MSEDDSSSREMARTRDVVRPACVMLVGGLALVMALVAGACASLGRVGSGPGGRIDFVADVKPILESRCLECHHDRAAATHAGLSLQTRRAALTTGRNAPVIVPGNPDGSLFYQTLLLGHSHPIAMPPSPDKLWDDQLRILHQWIEEGADWPAGSEGRLIPPQDWPEQGAGA